MLWNPTSHSMAGKIPRNTYQGLGTSRFPSCSLSDPHRVLQDSLLWMFPQQWGWPGAYHQDRILISFLLEKHFCFISRDVYWTAFLHELFPDSDLKLRTKERLSCLKKPFPFYIGVCVCVGGGRMGECSMGKAGKCEFESMHRWVRN